MGHPSVDQTALEKWLPLAQKGDETAVGMLIDATQGHLYRFCLYLSNNQAQAEDLCQETYLKTLNRLDSIEDASKLMPWLFRVAKNLFIDFTRSARSKENSIDPEEEISSSPSGSSGGGAPDTTLMVRACLARLKPEDRLVIVLVDSEGHSYSEAAQIIGITEEALKSRIHRARKAFLEIFHQS